MKQEVKSLPAILALQDITRKFGFGATANCGPKAGNHCNFVLDLETTKKDKWAIWTLREQTTIFVPAIDGLEDKSAMDIFPRLLDNGSIAKAAEHMEELVGCDSFTVDVHYVEFLWKFKCKALPGCRVYIRQQEKISPAIKKKIACEQHFVVIPPIDDGMPVYASVSYFDKGGGDMLAAQTIRYAVDQVPNLEKDFRKLLPEIFKRLKEK